MAEHGSDTGQVCRGGLLSVSQPFLKTTNSSGTPALRQCGLPWDRNVSVLFDVRIARHLRTDSGNEIHAPRFVDRCVVGVVLFDIFMNNASHDLDM